MKLYKYASLAPFLFLGSLNAFADEATQVQGVFIKVGQAVIRYLETGTGQTLVGRHSLSIPGLRRSLTEKVVTAQSGPLTDNNGATVDALGGTGYIILDSAVWNQFFEQEKDVYYLVFHEMLRAAGYNDDNYVISRPLYPFPFHLKVDTRNQSVNEDTSAMYWAERLTYLMKRCDALTKKAEEIQLDNVVPDLKTLAGLLRQMEDMPRTSPNEDFATKFREPLDKVETLLNTTARIILYVTKQH